MALPNPAAEQLLDSLIAASPENQYAEVLAIPGAGVHAQVLRFSSALRGPLLPRIARLPAAKLTSFVKALAVFENTVGGLGSVTALRDVLPLVNDSDHALLDWVLSNTGSYWYYSHGAKSLAELQEALASHARGRAANERKEYERAAAAQADRAERATQNLFNAVRRGDANAVKALLSQGASPMGATPEGVSLAEFAAARGRTDIAALLSEPGPDTDAS